MVCESCGAPAVMTDYGWTTHRQVGTSYWCFHLAPIVLMNMEDAKNLFNRARLGGPRNDHPITYGCGEGSI